MNDNNYKVQVQNLTKNFGSLRVLDDISFDTKRGEFVCIVRPTGYGKTILLNLFIRIYMPTKGDLLTDGESVDPRKHNLVFAFQEPSALSWETAEGSFRLGLELEKFPKAEIDVRVEKIIKLMGLEELRNSYPCQLFVSTEQRIVIGRAFAMDPDLLLMDEPYGRMDTKLRFYLEDKVLRLRKEVGATVFLITHNTEEAAYSAERVMTPSDKPTTAEEVLDVDLPISRDVASPEFIKIRQYVTDQIKWW